MKNGLSNNNNDNNNNMDNDNFKNGTMHILLDVHLKIRVIELMICYANDIFANLD